MGFAVLFTWPLVVGALFKKLPLQLALIWSIVAGYLFLPSEIGVSIDLPLLPPIDKILIPAIAAALMSILVVRAHQQKPHRLRRNDEPQGIGTVLPGWLPRSKLGFALSVLFVFGAVMSVLTNGDVIRYGPLVLPAQRPYDIFAILLTWGVAFLPMLLGRKFLADSESHKLILHVLCICALIYSIFMLYEVRMSPRVNQIIYGFFPHDWQQHRRGGGWRPIVFLNHGLLVGIYISMSVIATAILVRLSTGGAKLGYTAILLWLLGTLVLGKTLGALVLAMILVPVALFAPVRIQLMFAAIMAGIVMLYPTLRGAGLIPVDEVVTFFESAAPERAGSLRFRLHHEEVLLAHANERPLFGWSGWSRWRVFDPDTGRDLTVSDGFWVIMIGQTGWVGYVARFGLFCLPMMVFFLRRKRMNIDVATAGLCLVVLANLFDLLPNASDSPVFYLLVGALLGRLELQRETASDASLGEKAVLDPVSARRRGAGPVPDTGPDTGPDLVPEPKVTASRYSRFAPNKTRGET